MSTNMNLVATSAVNLRDLARILHDIQQTKQAGTFEFNQEREGEIFFQNDNDRTAVVWPTCEHGYPFIADTKVQTIARDDAMSQRWGLECCNVVACRINKNHSLASDICTHLEQSGFVEG